MRIRNATSADIDPLVALARRSFFDAYCETDDHAVIEEYCARNFTHGRFDAILADPRSTLLLAEDRPDTLAGYAHVARSPAPGCVAGLRPIELVRLYLAREWIGRGVGAELMRASIAEARRRGAGALWLGVYERNERAIAFYARFGMRMVGTKPWEWGGEIFQDPVMELAL